MEKQAEARGQQLQQKGECSFEGPRKLEVKHNCQDARNIWLLQEEEWYENLNRHVGTYMSQKSQRSSHGGTNEDLLWFIASSSLACVKAGTSLHSLSPWSHLIVYLLRSCNKATGVWDWVCLTPHHLCVRTDKIQPVKDCITKCEILYCHVLYFMDNFLGRQVSMRAYTDLQCVQYSHLELLRLWYAVVGGLIVIYVKASKMFSTILVSHFTGDNLHYLRLIRQFWVKWPDLHWR